MNQLETDIKNWAEKKLQEWTCDVEMRCSAVDLPGSVSMAISVSLMMDLSATFIALTTDAPADVSGEVFAQLVKEHLKRRPDFEKFVKELNEWEH